MFLYGDHFCFKGDKENKKAKCTCIIDKTIIT